MDRFDLNHLRAAVDTGTAIRMICRLQPAGGQGDKVFPPTYAKEGRAETKYALEQRWLDGRAVNAVLLDSVASQANRLEELLLDTLNRGEIDLPVVVVDFCDEADLQDLDRITSLSAPPAGMAGDWHPELRRCQHPEARR